MTSGRLRVAVCGTRFGRAYMMALGEVPGLELTAILARGSPRSRACAQHYGVPLVADPDALGDDVGLACVVIGGALNGGSGATLARSLLRRGVPVLQEHPLTAAELEANLREAAGSGVPYWSSNHYSDAAPVRAFLRAVAALRSSQPLAFVDVVTSIILLNPVLDVLTRAVGRMRPVRLSVAEPPPVAGAPAPYRVLHGVIGGVPASLRVQNEVDPASRDSSAHVLARITVGAEGGNVLLADVSGPVLWQPRMAMPGDDEGQVRLDGSGAAHLDLPGCTVLAPGATARETVGRIWPGAIASVLARARDQLATGADHRPDGQRQLVLSRLTESVGRDLGLPALRRGDERAIVRGADAIASAMAAGERG